MICKECFFYFSHYKNKQRQPTKAKNWCSYNGGRFIKNNKLKNCPYFKERENND